MRALQTNDCSYTDIRDNSQAMEKAYGFDLSKYKGTTEMRKTLRNCVKPEVGKFIFEKYKFLCYNYNEHDKQKKF